MLDRANQFSYGRAYLFFVSFHLLCNMILLSLLQGLIWEVFVIVEEKFDHRQVVRDLNKKKHLIDEDTCLFNHDEDNDSDDRALNHNQVEVEMVESEDGMVVPEESRVL